MKENIILDESLIEEKPQEEFPKIQYRKKNKNEYKQKECKVINYDKHNGYLDVSFDGYGVRIKDVKDFAGDTAIIKYKGEIGKRNFECKL